MLLYQVGQGTESGFSPDPPGKAASYISALAWAPDSRYIAFGYGDGSISLWDTRSASHVLTYNGSSGQVENIVWSPDGKLIASGGVQEVVRICRASDGTIVSIYAGNSISEKWLLSWSPDSTRVAIENDGPDVQSAQLPSQTLQVWDVSAGKTLFTFADAPMLSVAWSPDGKLVASVDSDGKVYLWMDSDGKLLTSYAAQNPPYLNKLPALLWSPVGSYLALDTWYSVLQVWNVRTNATQLIPIDLDLSRAIAWLPDGRIALIDDSKATQYIKVTGL